MTDKLKTASDYTDAKKIAAFDTLLGLVRNHFEEQTNIQTWREDPDSKEYIFEFAMQLLGHDVFDLMADEQGKVGIIR